MAKKPKAPARAETEAPAAPAATPTMPPLEAPVPATAAVTAPAIDEPPIADEGGTPSEFPKPEVSAEAVAGPASDQATGDPRPESPPAATEITASDDQPAAPAAGSTPAAGGDPPVHSPEARVFSIASARTVLHDGDLFLPGDAIVLTRAEHEPLFTAGAVAEPWNA